MFVIALSPHCTQSEREAIVSRSGGGLEGRSFPATGGQHIVVGHALSPSEIDVLAQLPGVEGIDETSLLYPLASRVFQKNDTTIAVGPWQAGGTDIGVIAGPCAVESRQQIIESAWAVKEAGAIALRGGAYKPRTSPHSFQGHGPRALEWLAEARELTGLPIVTEVLDTDTLPLVSEFADVLQIGTRNMQNFSLLRQVGRLRKPVLLKRGMHCTLEEWLSAAEYILQGGNQQVMLCERGIRTFSRTTRNTFDVNILPVLKEKTHLPVIADPSHAVGDWRYVEAISKSAIAAGADGLLLEVHPDPENALSDGQQSLTPERFHRLITQLRRIALAVDRDISSQTLKQPGPIPPRNGVEPSF